MSLTQKNTDGIRRLGSGPSQGLPLAGPAGPKPPRPGEPIRLTPKHAEREEAASRRVHVEKEAEEIPVIPEPFADVPPTHPWSDLSLSAKHHPQSGHGIFSLRRGASPPAPTLRKKSWGQWGAWTGGGVIVVAFILATTVFARLTVVVRPSVEEAQIVHVGMLLDTTARQVSTDRKIIPAEKLSFSRVVTREFPATGKARVEEGARGVILIYNAFNTSTQILVAGTRFATDTGAIYRIQKAVTVPGAKMEQGKLVPQAIEAEAVSDVKGDGANAAGPVTLKLPGFTGTPRYQGFYATAAQGFSGGFKGDSAVVTKEDITKAQEQVTKAAFSELEAEMGRKIPAGLLMLKELRDVEIVKVDIPRVGSRANGTFSVSAEAKGTALAFRESDAASVAAALALAGEKNRMIIPDSVRLSYAVRHADFDKGKAELTVGGDLKTKSVIAERELALLIAGKKEGRATELFKARPELASFSFSFFPPWRTTAPANAEKITFQVENP